MHKTFQECKDRVLYAEQGCQDTSWRVKTNAIYQIQQNIMKCDKSVTNILEYMLASS